MCASRADHPQRYRPLSIADQLAVSDILPSGGIIAYPTEAVFGLGCDPYNEAAVLRLLQIKQRSVRKGIILVAASIEQLNPYTEQLTDAERHTLAASWPGPVTWLIPNTGAAPDWITGQYDSLAVRVSDHPTVQALCSLLGGAIVSTSANISNTPPARWQWNVRKRFRTQVDWIVSGKLGGRSRPTAIKDLRTGVTIREG